MKILPRVRRRSSLIRILDGVVESVDVGSPALRQDRAGVGSTCAARASRNTSSSHYGQHGARAAREARADPLDGLRAAIGRSGAKHLALDHLTLAPSLPLDVLRDQRCRLAEQLGPEPPDVSMDVRRLIDEQRRAHQWLRDAQARLRHAEQDRDRLGPIAELSLS